MNEKPIVFLSHKSEDKSYVEDIGNYLMNTGINIYLDKNDPVLQRADRDVENVPDYLKIEDVIEDIEDMNNYIKKITKNHNMMLFESWNNSPQVSGEYIIKSSFDNKLAKYLKVR